MTGAAIVHDFFIQDGGAERCAVEFSRLLPRASIYTSFFAAARFRDRIDPGRVHSWPLQRLVGDAELAVDRETGGVKVERYLASYDVGVAVNPMLVEGQIVGLDPERRRYVVLAADQGGGVVTHAQTPCFKLASMKGSRSPSSTFCVAETS